MFTRGHHCAMAYTMERLEQALRLFRKSKRRLSKCGLPHKHLEDCIKSKYDLRIREPYHDKVLDLLDETDNNDSDVDYDPRQALRKKRPAPTNSAQERPAKRRKENGLSSTRQRDTLPITLKLSSATGRSLLSKIAFPINRGLDNDDGHFSAGSQPYLPTTLSSGRHSLRSRDNIPIPRNARSGSEPRSTRSLLSLDPDHPAARGLCREDQVDCDLIIPPGQKRGCENCKRKGLVCSYDEEQEDHRLPCQQCQKAKLQCIAGPADDRHQSDPSTVDASDKESPCSPFSSVSLLPQSSQSSLSETNSINSLHSLSVCANLPGVKGFQPTSCLFKTPSHRLKESRARLESMLSKPWDPNNLIKATPEPPQQPPEKIQLQPPHVTNTPKGKQGRTRVITMSFAHPINFAYEPPDDDDSKPCHWCNDFTYGIFGLGEVKVEVIEYEDQDGLVEIEGGHVGQGHEPSRMCAICALERIHIVNCREHTISALQGYDPLNFDYDAAFDSLAPLLPDSGNSGDKSRPQGPKQINPWCMLCPNPAFFGCTTIQSVDKFQEPVCPSSPSAVGCGLLLCTNCAQLMQTCQSDI
ncbi:C6 finger domain protein [Rasamsonia emersonii CBS 393.64]|uniref:C6 finger domain protein n=1 Tax=Rasamsonia emersonii (strain ATCC 16479 / CBS 393.64 / IMI 116815) TaxID=1408163 RepID=A0A0F4YX27_RASE3|nr:C6 finger domain protein [Rasamsonia emersonii CBS 393.64]KKA22630.1 C6 finger domain protein [Rasamsonia emersonii CBS 393.64]